MQWIWLDISTSELSTQTVKSHTTVCIWRTIVQSIYWNLLLSRSTMTCRCPTKSRWPMCSIPIRSNMGILIIFTHLLTSNFVSRSTIINISSHPLLCGWDWLELQAQNIDTWGKISTHWLILLHWLATVVLAAQPNSSWSTSPLLSNRVSRSRKCLLFTSRARWMHGLDWSIGSSCWGNCESRWQASAMATISSLVYCVVIVGWSCAPGEAIYLPAGWSHQVRSLAESKTGSLESSNGHLGLNYWFHSPLYGASFDQPYGAELDVWTPMQAMCHTIPFVKSHKRELWHVAIEFDWAGLNVCFMLHPVHLVSCLRWSASFGLLERIYLISIYWIIRTTLRY